MTLDQANDGGLVGVDTDDLGPPLDLPVEPFKRMVGLAGCVAEDALDAGLWSVSAPQT